MGSFVEDALGLTSAEVISWRLGGDSMSEMARLEVEVFTEHALRPEQLRERASRLLATANRLEQERAGAERPSFDAWVVTEDGEEPWESGQGEMVVRLLKVLRDQGGTAGLTKAEARVALRERFYHDNATALRGSRWLLAWERASGKRSIAGDPVMINVSGQRWAIDGAALEHMERAPERDA